MRPSIRLGYFVPQFPGQTHIFFWRELKELEKLGVVPHLISTTPAPRMAAHQWAAHAATQTHYLIRRDLSAALGLIRWPGPKTVADALRGEPFSHALDFMLALPAARELLKYARKKELDHIHVHSCGRAALIAAIAHCMGGPRYSLTLHGPLSDYGPGQRFKWSHAAFATVITQRLLAESRRMLGTALPAITQIQAMGVDTSRMSRQHPWQAPEAGEAIRIFSCGRLNPVKGYVELFEAIRLLQGQGLNLTLAVAGEDDDGGTGYRRVLEAHIESMGLQSTVTLLGSVAEDIVHDHLTASHIFILASRHEPLGVALMEAMSCEIPTIGTNSGGVPELITDGVEGILAPSNEPSMLADAIVRVLGDAEQARAMGVAGRKRVIAQFSAEKSAETLVDLVRQVAR